MSTKEQNKLIEPYGGELVDLLVPPSELDELKSYASSLPYIQISSRSACDLELLTTGAFSPLNRFMGQADHEHVVHKMRLTNEAVFPIPITLPVNPDDSVHLDQDIALRDSNNRLLAFMTIEEIYEWDRAEVELCGQTRLE